MTAKVRITVDGKLALTIEQAAARYGIGPSSVRAIVSRAQCGCDAMLDGRKPLYLAKTLDTLVKGRPGKGANLRTTGRNRA